MAVAEEEGPAGGDSVEAGAGTAMGASWFVTFPSIADPRSFASLSNDSGLFVMFTYPRIIILGESLTQLIVYLRTRFYYRLRVFFRVRLCFCFQIEGRLLSS